MSNLYEKYKTGELRIYNGERRNNHFISYDGNASGVFRHCFFLIFPILKPTYGRTNQFQTLCIA